ncbi:MAG TPA: YfhO family protein, partial [Acidimicrobiales bacterium]|nr:YfhO family protein [Acidimicrobiales bacterium]
MLNRLRARIGPLWPYVLLTAIPAAAFILPDLFGGHLLMTGDNAQQNYPLHVLVGSMLRHGQLPFWNPYIFSGSPLLADFNAGAFYPLMGFFVILPDRAAWVATEVVLFSGIATGMYVFLRALRLTTVPSVIAAGTFAFSGVVLSQVNHVDMTEGFVALPLMLLAVLQIVRNGRWRWSILFAAALALVILGGAPEAMLDEALFVLAYALVSAGLNRSSWWPLLSRLGAGAVIGLSLAAIEWLPGLSAVANSQRSGASGAFATAGSFPPADGWLSLVPYLYGGYNNLGETGFFAHYNLPEIGIYIGILPIIGLVALLHPRWPSRLPSRDRLAFYLVGVFALLLALGSNTPLEHLFNQIPLYGHQRLQSRNMIGVSFAACVLFAGWLDRRPEDPGDLRWFDRIAAFVPAVLVLGLTVWALFNPNSLISTLTGTTPSFWTVKTVREASIIALAFAVTAGVIVLFRSRWPADRWFMVAGVFVALDVGLAAMTSQLATFPLNSVLSGTAPIEQYLAAHLTPGGRYDIYDPQGYSYGPSGSNPQPDDNILAKLPTISGYASIVNGNYNTVTYTHSAGNLNITALGNGQLDDLDLQILVGLPQYFLVPVATTPRRLAAVQIIDVSRGSDPNLPFGSQPNHYGSPYPAYASPRNALTGGQSDSWYFGESLRADHATLVFTKPSVGATIRFGVLGTAGTARWGPPVAVPAGSLSVSSSQLSGNATGLAVEVMGGELPSHQAVIAVGASRYELDGSLSAVVRPGTWEYDGAVGSYAVFWNPKAPHPFHTVGAPGTAPPIHIVASTTKSETVTLRTPYPISLVRDVAWDSGWRAQVSVN